MKNKMMKLCVALFLILTFMTLNSCAGEVTITTTITSTTQTTKKTSTINYTTPQSSPTTTKTVTKLAPKAQIAVSAKAVKFGESITFIGENSSDTDGTIVSYKWDFGNGDVASGATVTYTYSDRGGKRVVKLEVTDNDDLSNTAETSVEIKLGLIGITAATKTWMQGAPYDIYGGMKARLESVGFEVFPPKSADYNANLLVDYVEKQGARYQIGGYGTDISCNITLIDKDQNPIYNTIIFGSTPIVSHMNKLYSEALASFLNQGKFRYLGEIIATKLALFDGVSIVVKNLQDKDEAVRLQAVEALEAIGNTTAVDPLIQALKDANKDVRLHAARCLGIIGDEKAVEPLIGMLTDNGWGVKDEVIVALGKIGDAKAVEPLIQILKDKSEDFDTLKYTSSALANIGEPAVLPLIGLLGNEDRDIGERVENTLVEMGKPAVLPLIKALEDVNHWIRYRAVRILGRIGDNRAVDPIIQALLHDESSGVRYEAAVALGELGDSRAIGPLTTALNDENESVRQAAARALKKIRGY